MRLVTGSVASPQSRHQNPLPIPRPPPLQRFPPSPSRLLKDDASPISIPRPTGTRGIRMKKQDFDRLVASVRQAGAIRRGEMQPSRVTEFPPLDVKAIRKRLGKSQSEFALMIGVSLSTLQNWEQGRRRPEGPARALLKIAAHNPEAVAAALKL